MSEPLVFECPSCGSPLTTDGATPQVVCQYCGRTVTVPEALRVHHEAEPSMRPIVVEFQPAARPPEPEERPRRGRRRGGGCGCAFLPAILIVLAALAGPSLLSSNRDLQRLQAAPGLQTLQIAAGLPALRPTEVPVNRPLPAPATQKVAYANLQFSVTGGTITNQVPADATNHERALRSGQAHAYMNVKVSNPTNNGIEADTNLLALQLGDGERYREESGWAQWLDAQSTQQARLYFTVPVTATWQGAHLVISQPGKEPAALALDGPAAPARYPIDLKAQGKATVQGVDYAIQSASLDLDAGGKRAATGRRFLRLHMRMFNHSGAAGGVAITPSDFRLAAGEDMLAPYDAPSEAVADNSVLQADVVFDVPADAGHVELQVGETGRGETRRLPVTMPAP